MVIRYWNIRARQWPAVVIAAMGRLPNLDYLSQVDDSAAGWPKGQDLTPFGQLPAIYIGMLIYNNIILFMLPAE